MFVPWDLSASKEYLSSWTKRKGNERDCGGLEQRDTAYIMDIYDYSQAHINGFSQDDKRAIKVLQSTGTSAGNMKPAMKSLGSVSSNRSSSTSSLLTLIIVSSSVLTLKRHTKSTRSHAVIIRRHLQLERPRREIQGTHSGITITFLVSPSYLPNAYRCFMFFFFI